MNSNPSIHPTAALDTQDLKHPLDALRLASILSLAKSDDTWDPMILPDLSDPTQADFGAYQLLELIGQGGMGLVYRALQKSLNREVALKLLGPTALSLAGSRERFLTEARHAATLNHPNILPVLEVGSHAGIDFLSMPLARGETLAHRCRLGALAPKEALQLMIPITEAIDYAHRLGLLHLDLKPANILIDEHGQPLVADFGLARPMDERGQVLAQEVSGTPGFMAPEQVLIKEFRLSRSTDVYALGAILYRLVSGRSAHGSGDARTIMQRVLAGNVEPLQHIAGMPADLAAICAKAMAWRQEDRYETAAVMLDDLRRFQAGLDISARRPGIAERAMRWLRREPALASLSGALLLAGVGLAGTFGWMWTQQRALDQTTWQIAAMALESDSAILPIPMLNYDADVLVPVSPCMAAGRCPRSVFDWMFLGDGDENKAIQDRVLAGIEQGLLQPDALGFQHERLQRLHDRFVYYRDSRLLQHHVDAFAADASVLGLITAANRRSPGGYATVVQQFDLYVVNEQINGATPPKVMPAQQLFEQAMSRRREEWEFYVVAKFCNVDVEPCLSARRDFANRAPDNAVADLLQLPDSIQSEPGNPIFRPEWDAIVLAASQKARFEQTYPEVLPAALDLAARVKSKLAPTDAITTAFLARSAYASLGDSLLHRLGAYCRISAMTRDRADIETACAQLFQLATKQDPRFLRDATVARCYLLHYLPEGEARSIVQDEFRQLSWLTNARHYIAPGRDDDALWLQRTPTDGSLGYVKQAIDAQGIPTEPPAGFQPFEPLPWRDANGQRIAYAPPQNMSACGAL
ncbi:serine/threonine-protein kinase [Ahniella affigens]|nr:serine/threonine-protein kinase [Ahniella affigens]